MQAFSYIDPEPLASASVAQVHAATMVGGGKQVVLKVLKPGVEDVLTTDLNFLYLAVRLLQIASPELERTSITGIIEDIRSSMLDEVRPRRPAPRALPRYIQSTHKRPGRCMAVHHLNNNTVPKTRQPPHIAPHTALGLGCVLLCWGKTCFC